MQKLFILLVAMAAVAAAAELDLDNSNFQSTIDKNDYVLVMFFAPWCGHCKALKPKYTEAAEKAEKDGLPFVLAKVDCTQDDAKPQCEKFGVKGYPTLKFFKKGQAVDYNGPRERDGILAWLEKKSGPAAATLTTEDEVKEFAGNTPALVGFFDGETAGQKAFFEAADSSKLEEVRAAQVLDKKLFGDRKDGEIVFFTKDGEQTFTAGDDADKLATDLFQASFPLVQEVGGHNFQKYVTLGKPLYLMFVEPTDENKDQLVKDLEAVAAKHTDEAFSWIDAVKYKAQVKGMGASGDQVPCIIRMSSFGSDNKPIVLEKAGLNEEIIGEWVEGIASGKYAYTPKSEAIPENNDKPVTVLVGKNFDDIVKDSNKHVFVEFYAPWCGHCKKLAPEWDQLGEDFADDDSVVIAKIDATANDVEAGAEVRGFPTLLLYPKDNKDSPKTYSGTREAKPLGEWLRKELGLGDSKASEAADDKDEL